MPRVTGEKHTGWLAGQSGVDERKNTENESPHLRTVATNDTAVKSMTMLSAEALVRLTKYANSWNTFSPFASFKRTTRRNRHGYRGPLLLVQHC